MKTERRVAIYARVSTTSGQNPEMQIRELREHCKNRDWKIVGEFVDSGISGATDSLGSPFLCNPRGLSKRSNPFPEQRRLVHASPLRDGIGTRRLTKPALGWY